MKKNILILVTSLILIGCGGGGSDSTSDNNRNKNNDNTGSKYEKDTTPPEISILGSNSATIQVCSTLHMPTVKAVDNKDGKVDVYEWSGFKSFDTCKIGEHEFIYRAEDSSGNYSTAKFIVKVIGIELRLKDGNETTVYQYTDYYNDPGYIAKSSYDNNINVEVTGYVNTDKPGSYILSYKATDGKGNTRTVTRTVNVVKNPYVNVQKVSTVTQFRKALENASSNGKDDVIILSAGIYKTTEDSQGTFDFNDNEKHTLRIYGNESETTIMDGDNTDRVFDFDNSTSGKIIIKHLDIRNGQDNGVSSEEYISLHDCKVHDNIGHGIYAKAGIMVSGSEIYNNTHIGDNSFSGGGIYSSDNTAIFGSKIYNNITEYEGGGIYSEGNLDMYLSDVYNNTIRRSSSSMGGGIYISSYYASSFIYNSTIHNNISLGYGGGIYDNGDISIHNSKIYSNRADDNYGGIHTGKLYIEKSEVKDNNASAQGGIHVFDQIEMYDSNVTGNLSTFAKHGGGVCISDGWDHDTTSVIASSSISDNKIINKYNSYYSSVDRQIAGVGVYIYWKDSLYIMNSIISNNTAEFTYGGTAYGVAIFGSSGSNVTPLRLFNNTIVNNTSSGADNTYGTIYGFGMFHNNIIDKNTGTISFQGDSEVYSNYVDYSTFLNENKYTIIKKGNIVPQADGVTYNTDFTLPADSILIDQGTLPTKNWFGDDYYDKINFYNKILKELKNDKSGNHRGEETLDIGAYEYKE